MKGRIIIFATNSIFALAIVPINLVLLINVSPDRIDHIGRRLFENDVQRNTNDKMHTPYAIPIMMTKDKVRFMISIWEIKDIWAKICPSYNFIIGNSGERIIFVSISNLCIKLFFLFFSDPNGNIVARAHPHSDIYSTHGGTACPGYCFFFF